MKKSKIILIAASIACIVLAGITVAIAFNNKEEHIHTYVEGKTFHIGDDIYYTQQCEEGHISNFDTNLTFAEIMNSVSATDKIVLDEDFEVGAVELRSYISNDNVLTEELNLIINLNLNGNTLYYKNATEGVKDTFSFFSLMSPYGKITLNIENGRIQSTNLSHIFEFHNNGQTDSINLNLNNVECITEGESCTPIYANDTSENISVTANNCKFIGRAINSNARNTSVGLYVNSKSTFIFTNCYFEGGDAVYVKQGYVKLDTCELINNGLTIGDQTPQNSESAENVDFVAAGACLTTDSYTTLENGVETVTQFNIDIINCVMEAKTSNVVISNAYTGSSSTGNIKENENSMINIYSCKFAGVKPATSSMIKLSTECVLNNGYWVVG